MSRTERCHVREFKARMCALEPGDVLAPLSSAVPPGYRILVLDRTSDGGLILSLHCDQLRIVADKKGPFHWLEEDETIVDGDNNPHELINLNTMVVKGAGLALVSEFHELSRWAKTFQVVSGTRIKELVNADMALRRRIDAVLQNDWLPSVEARLAAAFEQIFDRPLTESEQAHVIALTDFVAQAIPTVDVVIVPGRHAAEAPPGTAH